MTNRAVIYARVSTDEQAEKGRGLKTQVRECLAYAEQNGFEIAFISRRNYR